MFSIGLIAKSEATSIDDLQIGRSISRDVPCRGSPDYTNDFDFQRRNELLFVGAEFLDEGIGARLESSSSRMYLSYRCWTFLPKPAATKNAGSWSWNML